ncbi:MULTISPECIES: hypothetical protein [unclassified Microcoleus]|uniref:hypothetical protein n=1 Tax=unclassified Microcoleus TaxID=2642155 RepID=UPI002FD09E26
MLELPWEKNSDGKNAFLKKRKTSKISPALMKLIAYLKLTDVTLVSARFHDSPIVFEPWASVFVDSSTKMEFLGVYSRAFANSEDEQNEPQKLPCICLRKAVWNKADDFKFFNKKLIIQKEYVLGESQVRSLILYPFLFEADKIIALVYELFNMTKQGIKIQDIKELEQVKTNLDFIEYCLGDGYLSHDFSYNPYRFKCDALASWTVKWRAAFEEVDDRIGFIPDEGSKISYQSSLIEQIKTLENY